jgi:S1-C subfamily serine protease
MSEGRLKKGSILLAVTLILVLGVAFTTAKAQSRRSVTVQVGDEPEEVMIIGDGSGWLGISIAEVTAQQVKELKLPEERGVVVKSVETGSPAEKAGLKENDVIVEYAGHRVEGTRQLRRLILETPAGRSVTLGVYRAGQKQSLTATLAERREHFPGMHMGKLVTPDIHIPSFDFEFDGGGWMRLDGSRPRLGVEVESLSDQLAQFFGVAEGEGVLVRSVQKGGAAEKAGIKAGDVITKIEGEKISETRDVRQAMYKNRDKKSVAITAVRNRAETTFTVEIEKPQREKRTISSRVGI